MTDIIHNNTMQYVKATHTINKAAHINL